MGRPRKNEQTTTTVAVGADFVVIGCRLPHGIILELPDDPKKTAEIAGLNRSRIIGATHMTTRVDAGFWKAWKAKNAEFPALVSQAIFEASSESNAEAIAKEVKDEATGFEPVDPEANGVNTADFNSDD